MIIKWLKTNDEEKILKWPEEQNIMCRVAKARITPNFQLEKKANQKTTECHL